jgi:G3E family GTPase
VRLKELYRAHKPEYLFVEPAAMVTTQEMKYAASIALRDVKYEIGPFITLVNAAEYDDTRRERESLLMAQVHGADVTCVTKGDLAGPQRVNEIKEDLGVLCPRVIALNPFTGEGIPALIDMIGLNS